MDSADKKLRDTVQFLEVQANEREMERDETQRELTELKVQLAQRERECAATQNIAQEVFYAKIFNIIIFIIYICTLFKAHVH